MRSSLLLVLGASLLVTVAVTRAGNADEDERLLKDAQIASDGPGLLTFFKKRTVGLTDEARLRALIAQLGDDDFNKREGATRDLVAIGSRARPALSKAKEDADVEVARRAENCLKRIDQGATGVVLAAGVRVLARSKVTGAVETLLAYLPSAEDEFVAEEIRVAMASLAVRDGKADPALVATLTDPSAIKRAAAAVALTHAPGQLDAIRKMLKDPDPTVRMRVALALTAARDKEAVPVLIQTLARLEPRERGMVEDLLNRLAEDKAPVPNGGTGDAAQQKRIEAWLAWWSEAGPKLDPARLEEATRTLNYTLIVLLDLGRIVDLDNRNQPRWQIDNLQFPLDAQLLPGDRVLVAEHKGNVVTERNKKNEVLWKKELSDGPIMAQRLPNGNTFIATKSAFSEYDKDGKEVFHYQMPNGEQIMKAQKLRNGDIACICQLGITRYVRLDPTGKEIQSFGVDLRHFGGRVDVLPNGHVLVPEMANNRVVEHDTTGKIVWDVALEQPIAAVRLPNGNTLVTSLNLNGAVEVDRAGKQVWSYKTDTRVTRAFRR